MSLDFDRKRMLGDHVNYIESSRQQCTTSRDNENNVRMSNPYVGKSHIYTKREEGERKEGRETKRTCWCVTKATKKKEKKKNN